MKKIGGVFIAILLMSKLHAQQQFSKEQRAAQQVIVAMFEALSNRDAVSLKACCTADISFYEYGQVWNMDTLISKAIVMNQAADFKRSNTFDFINTSTDKNMAWVTYRLHSAIFKEGKQANLEWLETVVLAKEKNQWKIKQLHSTLIKRS
jgi:ketosteroid isomerase-like protein